MPLIIKQRDDLFERYDPRETSVPHPELVAQLAPEFEALTVELKTACLLSLFRQTALANDPDTRPILQENLR